MDAKLSSWALNLNPHPVTTVPNGSFPTQLPQIFTGFGDPEYYPNVIGIPGQLMSIMGWGDPEASCALNAGTNGQCVSVSIEEACGSF